MDTPMDTDPLIDFTLRVRVTVGLWLRFLLLDGLALLQLVSIGGVRQFLNKDRRYDCAYETSSDLSSFR